MTDLQSKLSSLMQVSFLNWATKLLIKTSYLVWCNFHFEKFAKQAQQLDALK